ncbi:MULTISPECIES: FliO/MopB family protein [Thalassobaculum]|uniref:Flagellar biosynthesis protein, FliO n=1 Tax=Thalassobaculum litoreum DSM 18839 TaxID=1123362 RepID=A0A8G2EWE4_9PROT|nr:MULTISPECIES: flagellar biosynthetic protein FliO [Thalassobaculum]SDG26956.1 Flagellar biosynthesis protein, FliO [Thalassobaculum litoreum DSM 18839]
MGLFDYIRFILAFAFVLGLIGICYWLVRRYAVERFGLAMNVGKTPRLRIVENRVLDGRRRLILVRRDEVEHLLVIGGESDMVVETGIPAPPLPVPQTTGDGADR